MYKLIKFLRRVFENIYDYCYWALVGWETDNVPIIWKLTQCMNEVKLFGYSIMKEEIGQKPKCFQDLGVNNCPFTLSIKPLIKPDKSKTLQWHSVPHHDFVRLSNKFNIKTIFTFQNTLKQHQQNRASCQESDKSDVVVFLISFPVNVAFYVGETYKKVPVHIKEHIKIAGNYDNQRAYKCTTIC